MNRVTFNERLVDALLYQLSAAEIHDYLDYYDQQIQQLMENGWSEKRAVASLGDPQMIAYQILHPEAPPKRKKSFWLILLLVVTSPFWGSGLLGILAIALAFYICIWCIPLVGATLAAGGIIGGGAAVLLSPFLIIDFWGRGLIQLGSGFLLIGAGLIAALLTYYLSKGLWLAQRRLVTFWKQQRLAKKAVFT